MADSSFKYKDVIKYIKELIESGKFRENTKLPTENEITSLCNVSRITAQKAFFELEKEGLVYRQRGKGTFVSPGRSSSTAGTQGKMKYIGVILPVERGWGISYDILNGIQDYAKKKNCYVTIHNSLWNAGEEAKIIRQLVENGASGIIVQSVSVNKNMSLFRELVQKKYPLVFIDRCPENLNVDFVCSDNYAGAYAVINHLIGLGHTRIAFLSDESNLNSVVQARYNGYCDALQENEIGFDSKWVKMRDIAPQNKLEQLNELVTELINVEPRPTAIFCINDLISSRVINSLIKSGLKVPDDISVAGFDNVTNTDHMLVPVTCVTQPLYDMGVHAARLLFKRLRLSNIHFSKLVLHVDLLIRDSTGAPAGM